jgi:CRP/FNR family transcriptional regulator
MLATAFAYDAEIDRGQDDSRTNRPIVPDLLTQRLSIGPMRTVEGREHIFREGDPASNVYMVEVGHVCIYKLLPDGRRQVIDFAFPGDLIGLGDAAEHASNAQATTRTRIRCIPVLALHRLARDDARLGLKLYEAVSRELRASREMLFTVSQRTAAERVAAFLLALSRRNERKGEDPLELVLPMTRADIADFLGLTIETVSRTFTRLRVEGVIDLTQCVLVAIVNHDALARLAEGRCN